MEEEQSKYSKPPVVFRGLIDDQISRPIPRKWTFTPQEDITAYEYASISPFLGMANKAMMRPSDLEYLEHYNLLRHFVIEDAPEMLRAINSKLL